MSFWQAAISGVVQGLTEFLPISSSGHLVLLHHFFGLTEPQLLFDIFLHLGTLLAVVVYFRSDILKACRDRRVIFLIILGSLPTALIGFYFESFLKSSFENVELVGMMLIVTAIFIFIASYVSNNKRASTKAQSLGPFKALLIGIAQGFSALPGISRSGATIAMALVCNVKKIEAIRFSFLLSIPAVLGALLFELRGLDALGSNLSPSVFVGILTAFVTGLIAIYLVIKAVLGDKLFLFGVYCLLVGFFVLSRIYLFN